MDNITRKLIAWKDALIDLSRRNPLLALPTRSLIRLAGSDTPDDLWKLPATGTKRLWFLTEKLPGTEVVRTLRARDRAVTAADFRTLNNLRLKSRLSLNEQGVNVLFLVLGVLEWYDPRMGSALRSPLLLMPVALDALPGKEGFLLYRFDEDPRVNPTLRFRLAQNDLNITLPDADPDEDGFTPSAYFARVAEAIANKPNWRVVTDECLIGRFSYLNLVMYEELDQRIEDARRHPLIAAIAGDTEAAQNLAAPETPDLDTEPPQMAYHVLPADPSQERAILAARYGQSMVIQGPPGTGKTQTITNLIATCIADGRRVLFVSEKMAALEAVYKRLQDCGLADLCLEAHSHKASKHQILEQLRATLDQTINTATARSAEMSVLATLRDDFNQSVAALHRRRDPLGLTVYEARGIVATLANTPDLYFALDKVEQVDAETYHILERLAERVAAFHDLFPLVENHPWRGIQADRFSQELYTRARDAVTDLLKAADALEDRTALLWSLLGLPARDSADLRGSDTDWALRVVEGMQQTPRPPSGWLTAETDDTLVAVRHRAVATQERFRRFEAERTTLLAAFTSDILALPHAPLAERLGGTNQTVLEPAFGPGWADLPETTFAQADTTLNVLPRLLEHLQRSAARQAELCGLPAPQTLGQARAQEQIVLAALTDPRPLSGWFERGGIALRRALLRDTEAREAQEFVERGAVGTVYTDQLYALDLDALRQRFETDHAAWTHVFKSAFYADRKALTRVLQPGASLAGRDIADDLRRACLARDLRQQLAAEAESLRDAIGPFYEGNRVALRHALDQIETLTTMLGGNIPAPLQTRLVASGAALAELREQYALVDGHLGEVERALGEAVRLVQLSTSATRPITQISFEEVRAACETLRPALADFTDARRTVRQTHRQPEQATLAELRDALARAAWSVAEDTAITEESAFLRATYAHLFAGLETDWTAVLSALDHAEQLRRVFAEAEKPIPDAVVTSASGGAGSIADTATQAAEDLRPRRRELDRVWLELFALFDTASLRTLDGSRLLDSAPFAEQRSWSEVRLGSLGQLERWLDFESLRTQCGRVGLLSFCEVMVRRSPPADQIPAIFRKAFHQRWLDTIAAETPALSALCAAEHTAQQVKFERLDRSLIAATPARIRSIARERRELVIGAGTRMGELGSLRRILSQTRPRASIRKILSDIPNLLFRLKPCLMMSPLSVSLFLDPQRIEFDIVIFDEASQIFPEFALGPLLRADQAVIAGDSRQLPPTSFFKGMQEETSEGDEDEEAAQAADPREFESILDAAKAPLAQTSLTWHYRSRHESLIAFSNGKFYHNTLKTFPSARLPSVVALEHVADGVYYGGAGNPRNNPREAVRVADLVAAQVRREPGASVGVITMSEAQQECIRAEIERRTAGDTTLATLLSEDRLDGFFIKNIENVQGDERDVIFLSVGYGKWPDGRVRMLFGPINREGGERRLNVAITRAKERLTVVSSLLPEDITLSDTTAAGPRLLREYLTFARATTGALEAGADTAGATDTFVEAVAQTLEAGGHAVRRLVGLSDYRIDLAVVDPTDPDRFLLGIECDSENYRSGETARAREWLRASVLNGLGWRLYRLWSGDWTRNPETALAEIETHIAAALAGEPIPEPTESAETEPAQSAPSEIGETPDSVSDPTPPPAHAPAPSEATPQNGLLPGLTFYVDASDFRLPGETQTLYGDSKGDSLTRAELVDRIVQREGPVHAEVIALRLCRAAGLRQTGPRIKHIAEDTLTLLDSAGRIEKRTDFVWVKSNDAPPARVPSPGSAPRAIEHISLEEIGEVAYVVLKNAIGMKIEEAVNETARTLGYERTGPAIRERIADALARLEFDNRIHNFHGQLRTFEEE